MLKPRSRRSPERDDVQWTKHILSRLDAEHVDDAEVVLEYREVIDQFLEDQMRQVPPPEASEGS